MYILFIAVTCTTVHTVEHFDVSGVTDDVTRLRAALSGMSDGDYFMGASVDDVGSNFHELNVSYDIDIEAESNWSPLFAGDIFKYIFLYGMVWF